MRWKAPDFLVHHVRATGYDTGPESEGRLSTFSAASGEDPVARFNQIVEETD